MRSLTRALLVIAVLAHLRQSIAQTADQTQQSESAAPLTVDAAIKIALQNHPLVFASQQRVAAAGSRLRSASAERNPEITIGPTAGSREVGGADEELILAKKFEISGRKGARTGVARYTLQATRFDATAVQRTIVFVVKDAYIDLMQALEIQSLNENLVSIATQFRDAAKRKFDLGDIPQVQVERAEIEVGRAQQELLTAQSEVAVRKKSLNTLMARDPDTPLALAESLKFKAVELKEDDLKRQAFEQRAEVKAAQAELRARQYRVSLAAADRRPDLMIEGRRDRIASANGEHGVRFALAFPLFDLGSIRHEVRANRAEVREQEAILNLTKNEIALEVSTALQRLQRAQGLVERYERDILPRTRTVLEVIQKGYDAGAVTFADVLDTQRTVRSTRSEYLQAVAAFNKAQAELEKAIGGGAYVN